MVELLIFGTMVGKFKFFTRFKNWCYFSKIYNLGRTDRAISIFKSSERFEEGLEAISIYIRFWQPNKININITLNKY